MPQTLTLRRNESRSEAHQKVEDSGGFDLDASPDTEELDLQVCEDAASAVVVALHCLGGERGDFLSHASSSLRLQSELHPDGETWLIMPVPGDCTFAIMCLGQERGLFLAHYDGEVYLTPHACDLCLYGGTFRSNGMATQFLAIQNGHGCV